MTVWSQKRRTFKGVKLYSKDVFFSGKQAMSYQYVSSDLTDSNAIVNRQRIANKKTFKKTRKQLSRFVFFVLVFRPSPTDYE